MSDKVPIIGPGIIPWIKKLNASTFNKEARDEAIRLWMYTSMFPTMTGDVLIDLAQGKRELSYNDDGSFCVSAVLPQFLNKEGV